MIVICSPRSVRSVWVNREIARFKLHRDPKKVLALIIDGEPNAAAVPGREHEECFPPALVRKPNADFSVSDAPDEPPLAADARKEGDGRRVAKLKLAAAMLGIGLDDLVRRDERRRAARRRLVTASALTLSAAMTALAVAAVMARNEAVIARDEADFQRGEAEGLVEFMLTDLRKRLAALRRLDELETVGERALGYYARQDVAKLTADALGRRARAQLLLGEIHNTRGDFDRAVAAYAQAAATTAEQLRRHPDNPQQMFDHSQSLFWVGYAAWQKRDFDTTLIQFSAYHDLARRLVAIDPENEDWQAELGYTYSNLGTLALDTGDIAAAEASFRAAKDVSLRLAQAHPEDVDRMAELGQSYAWLGDTLMRLMKFDEARRERVAEADLYQRALKLDPENFSIRQSLIVAHTALARIDLGANDLRRARVHAAAASDIAAELAKRGDIDADLAAYSSAARIIQGHLLFYEGEHALARDAFAAAKAYAEPFAAKSGELAWLRTNDTEIALGLARIETALGRSREAVRLVREAVDALGPAVREDEDDRLSAYWRCEARAYLSRLDQAAPPPWEEIVLRLVPHAGSLSAQSLTLLAEAYARSDQLDDARAIALRLQRAGYRHPDFAALIAARPDLVRDP